MTLPAAHERNDPAAPPAVPPGAAAAPGPTPPPDGAPFPSGGPDTESGLRRYRVFLSYSHADAAWAAWLVRRLEGFRVPARLRGRVAPIGKVGEHIAPVFRDREELPTAHDLGETIRDALRRSATLVVLCSPAAARSRWVNEEILSFKRLHGSERVFAFIVDGEPGAKDPAQECFPPALRFALDASGSLAETAIEVIAADARPQGDGRSDAFLRLVAGLLGVGFDELRRRELQRRNRRLTWIAAGSVAGMALTLGLAVTAWNARNDARRRQEQGEELLAFMLGDQRDQLKRLGRLDVLDKVGEKALAYFGALAPRDLTDAALARHAQALRQIGENRLDQLRYAEAEQAIRTAHDRLAALVARRPGDGALLFERGQTEFYLGDISLRRREVAAAREWFVRYRDTTLALVALAPDRPDWQGELAYGHHNLAVSDLDHGRLGEARGGFQLEIAILERLLAQAPRDHNLQFRLADAESWLGSVEERDGHLAEAARRFARQVEILDAIVRADPGTARWQARLADALALQANLLAITGDRPAARERRERSIALFLRLTANDPSNRSWQRSLLNSQLKLARLLLADGASAEARRRIEQALAQLEKLAAAEPTDARTAAALTTAHLLHGRVLEAAEQSGPAAAAAARALALGEPIVAAGKATAELTGDTTLAILLSARLAARAGDPALARDRARQAITLIASTGETANRWPLLDAAARAHLLLGESDAAAPLLRRLAGFGYRPIEAWPETAALPDPAPARLP